jgi:hypothetical protein
MNVVPHYEWLRFSPFLYFFFALSFYDSSFSQAVVVVVAEGGGSLKLCS